MKKLLITIIFPVVLFVTGCSLMPKPHRIDIQQGNIITQEDVNQLHTGMNRKQVLFVMGSPIVADTFHQDRWDYYYSLSKGHDQQPTVHVSLLFSADRLIRIDGDLQPKPLDNQNAKGTRNQVITITPKEEQVGLSGLIDSMIDAVRSDDEQPVAKPETITKPQAPAAAGQKKEESGGFFDSFIDFFTDDENDDENDDEDQEPAEQGKTGSKPPSQTKPVDQQADESDSTDTNPQSPGTPDDEKPVEQPSDSGLIDSFIKSQSDEVHDDADKKQEPDTPVQ